jgi:hypothetical protein
MKTSLYQKSFAKYNIQVLDVSEEVQQQIQISIFSFKYDGLTPEEYPAHGGGCRVPENQRRTGVDNGVHGDSLDMGIRFTHQTPIGCGLVIS